MIKINCKKCGKHLLTFSLLKLGCDTVNLMLICDYCDHANRWVQHQKHDLMDTIPLGNDVYLDKLENIEQ
jgi:hypothetical protein